MAWLEDEDFEERRIRREEIERHQATNPQEAKPEEVSGWQHLMGLLDEWGNYLGERGWRGNMPVPPEQRTQPFPGTVQGSPFQVQTQVQPQVQPTDPTMPVERRETGYAPGGKIPMDRLWIDYLMPMGVTSVKMINPDLSTTNIKKTEFKPKGQPGQQQPGQKPQVPGVPPQQQPWSGMAQGKSQEQFLAEENARVVAEQQAMLAQKALAEKNVASTPYSLIFRAGEAPITPTEEYNRNIARAEKQEAENLAIIAKGTRSRGELLAEQYQNIAASTGKGMRIVMSALNFINKGNPLWTDEMASLGAEHEQARQAIIMDRSLTASDKAYRIKSDIITRLVNSQQIQRAEAKATLQQELDRNPARAQDPRWLSDWVHSNLHIAEKDVPTYLEERRDPKTGRYNITQSKYDDMVSEATYNANVLRELLPTLPEGVSIMAYKSPGVILKYYENKEDQFNYRASIAKTPEERDRWEKMRDVAIAGKIRLASDSKMWNLIQLEEEIRIKQSQNQPVSDTLWKDYKAAHKYAWGPSHDRDPKKLFIEGEKDKAELRGKLLENEERALAITRQREKAQVSKNIVDDIIGSFPGNELFRSKKATEDTQRDFYAYNAWVATAAIEGTLPTGDKPEEKRMRSYMHQIRGKTMALLPDDIKKEFGTLSDAEIIYFMETIYKAQTSSPPQIPNLYYTAELIRRERSERGGKKK